MYAGWGMRFLTPLSFEPGFARILVVYHHHHHHRIKGKLPFWI